MSYGTIDIKCLSFHSVTGVSLVGGAVMSDNRLEGRESRGSENEPQLAVFPRAWSVVPRERLKDGLQHPPPDVPTSSGDRAGTSGQSGVRTMLTWNPPTCPRTVFRRALFIVSGQRLRLPARRAGFQRDKHSLVWSSFKKQQRVRSHVAW